MIEFKKLYDEAVIPTRATDGSAGFDLYAYRGAWIADGTWVKISTGITVNVGIGYVGLICPRSGLAGKSGITVLNAPGVIDSDYRGEVSVLLHNVSGHRETYHLQNGMRIAQLVVVPCITDYRVVDSLDETARGAGGFGSTGI